MFGWPMLWTTMMSKWQYDFADMLDSLLNLKEVIFDMLFTSATKSLRKKLFLNNNNNNYYYYFIIIIIIIIIIM
jgi:hypothetical protein